MKLEYFQCDRCKEIYHRRYDRGPISTILRRWNNEVEQEEWDLCQDCDVSFCFFMDKQYIETVDEAIENRIMELEVTE